MVSKRFFLQLLLLRYVLLCGLSYLFLHAVYAPGYHATALLLAGVIIFSLLDLYRFITRGHRQLAQVIEAFECGDFSHRLETGYSDGHFPELVSSLQALQQHFVNNQLKQQAELTYFKAIVDHAPVGLIALHDSGKLDLLNSRSRQLFINCVPAGLDDFAQFGHQLPQKIKALTLGQTAVFDFNFPSGPKKLALSATRLTSLATHHLISLQNIQSQIDSAQLDAWQILVRVLTHEIMNSVTPVASLANTAAELSAELVYKNKNKENQESLQDIAQAASTVAKRAENLTTFVEAYRRVARLPEPKLKKLNIKTLLQRVESLVCQDWPQLDIQLVLDVKPTQLSIDGDEKMLEQVLINLLKNAQQALEEYMHEKKVLVTAEINTESRLSIRVEDNGPGVAEQFAQQIFVPFYTTKREGSGVGLALSRQIMFKHGGSLVYRQSELGGACFEMLF